jgi:predicted nucleotidyltransferase
MDVRDWMLVEYLEAREHINAVKKRNKQGRAKREYLEASTRRISSETSYSDFLLAEKKKQEEEIKEEA